MRSLCSHFAVHTASSAHFTYAAGDRKYLHHATREQREHITALEMDQENSYVQNLLLAIRGMAEPTTLDNAALLRLTDAIKAVFYH